MNHLKISKRVHIYLLASAGLGWFSRMPKPLTRFVWTMDALWRSVWLGLLDDEYLNEITWSYYMGKSGFEEEEFNIQQGLWPWEADAIGNHFIDTRRVLVAGAGGGREVIALVRRGYEVTAFDFSSHLTAACRRNLEKAGCQARVLDAPPNRFPKELDVYDALLIGRGFYHHIPGRTRRISFLKEGRVWLKSGAPILLSDFFTRSVNSRFHLRIRTIANFLRRLLNRGEQVELGDWLTNCMQHAFTRDEIEKELFEAGINLEIFAVSPFSDDSHLAHIVGRIS